MFHSKCCLFFCAKTASDFRNDMCGTYVQYGRVRASRPNEARAEIGGRKMLSHAESFHVKVVFGRTYGGFQK